jgi:hypothetical protein
MIEQEFKVGDQVRFKNRVQPAPYMIVVEVDARPLFDDIRIKLNMTAGWWSPVSLVRYNEQVHG